MLQNKMLAVVAGAFALCSATAGAQEGSTVAASSTVKGFAASTFETPVGFGGGWGSVGIGAFGQTLEQRNGNNRKDASAGASFGLGDPDEYVGLETTVVLSSLDHATGSEDGFGHDGTFGFKLHTNIPGDAAFGVGVIGAAEWGSDNFKRNNSSSIYAALTKGFQFGSQALILNIGVGDGLFNEPDRRGVGLFGSGAFYLTHWLSFIGEYTGRFANAAISVAPLPQYIPLTITVGAINLGKRYGADVEFGGSVGLGYNFN